MSKFDDFSQLFNSHGTFTLQAHGRPSFIQVYAEATWETGVYTQNGLPVPQPCVKEGIRYSGNYKIPQEISGFTAGSPTCWTCPIKPPKCGFWDLSWSNASTTWAHFSQCLPFDCYLTLEIPPDVSHCISKAEPSHPLEESNFSSFYLQPHSCRHNPKLSATDESWNVAKVVNWKICRLVQLPLF